MRMVYNEQLEDYICYGDNPICAVKTVKLNKNYTMLLTFSNGENRIYNAAPLLEKGIFSMLKNLDFFLGAKVDGDTVVWSDDVDIAPEHLYKHSILIENTTNE